MKNKDVETKNKLIAEFIGLKKGWWIHQEKPLTDDKKQFCDLDGTHKLFGSRVYYSKDLMFHSDWNWLITAWFHFQKLLKKDDNYKSSINLSSLQQVFCIGICEDEDILTCHHALVEGIKWYNENKKK